MASQFSVKYVNFRKVNLAFIIIFTVRQQITTMDYMTGTTRTALF